ncbi:MAG: helix-turn-helix transcriptional regulator [Burkholderiales bacterium]|jgi:AraC-like DNA-binding protein|nr:helix-turn-helix transcriptional regulator [Burkholderiales bacterium]
MSSAIRLFQGRFGRVALLDMTAPLVEHAHHHCHVLLKAGGSDSAFLIRGERQPLTDSTAVLVNAWEPHAYQHDLPPGQDTLILALYIEPSWLAEIQQSLTLSGHPRFFPRNCVEINSNTKKIVEEFVLELWWADDIAAARLENLLFSLMIAVIDSYSGWRDMAGLLRSRPPSAIDARIRRAIAYMRANVALDFDMAELAGEAGLSRAHFFSLFQRETQTTPLVYANVLRVEAAIRRLTEQHQSVTDISYALGFSAPGHFSRFFRQHIGITPTEYRSRVNLFRPDGAGQLHSAESLL